LCQHRAYGTSASSAADRFRLGPHGPGLSRNRGIVRPRGVVTGIVVRELTDAAAASWDQFVEGAAAATFFHRAAWKAVLERSFGHRAYFLFAEHHGVIEGVLPLVHISSRLFGNFLVSTAFGVYGGPAAASPSAAQALNRRALEIADRLDVS